MNLNFKKEHLSNCRAIRYTLKKRKHRPIISVDHYMVAKSLGKRSYFTTALGLAPHQLHEAVVLLVLVGQVADLADLLLALAALLVLQPTLLLLALLLQLPRARLLLAGRLLGRRTWGRERERERERERWSAVVIVRWDPVSEITGINGERREVR